MRPRLTPNRKDYPKIQILTIDGLLRGTERPDTPPLEDPFAKAAKALGLTIPASLLQRADQVIE